MDKSKFIYVVSRCWKYEDFFHPKKLPKIPTNHSSKATKLKKITPIFLTPASLNGRKHFSSNCVIFSGNINLPRKFFEQFFFD